MSGDVKLDEILPEAWQMLDLVLVEAGFRRLRGLVSFTLSIFRSDTQVCLGLDNVLR